MSMFGFTEPLARREERCECASCGWTGIGANLRPMEDLCVRIDAGEIVPAGECPECGALAHVINDDTRRRDAADAALIFVATLAATDAAFAAAARAAGAMLPTD